MVFTSIRWCFLGVCLLAASAIVYYILLNLISTTVYTPSTTYHVQKPKDLGQQSLMAESVSVASIHNTAWNEAGRSSEKKSHESHVILVWHNISKSSPNYIPIGDDVFHSLGCPVKSCEIQYNHEFLHNASAVIFIGPLLTEPIPKHANTQQRWIFFSQESPLLTHPDSPLTSWNNLFNWTMTYRHDSDFVIPFGSNFPKHSKKKQRSRDELLNIAKSKSKMAAWFVRNCNTPSHREDYVRELMTYIRVGVFGECGILQTELDWTSKDSESLKMLNKSFLFYLAFENSLCQDYVTEKFYKVLPYDVIPVVRGRANYSQLVPHKWFIDAADFQSPQHLAQYLTHLQHNPEEYINYLEHRDEYNFDFMWWHESNALCQLCERLNNPNDPAKTYHSITDWWSRKDCKEPLNMNITNSEE